MDIVEFFDPWNYNHRNDYDYFRKEGEWPRNSLAPIGTTFPNGWQLGLMDKISDFYLHPWINCKDRMPPLSNEYLCLVRKPDKPAIIVEILYNEEGFHIHNGFYVVYWTLSLNNSDQVMELGK